MPDLTPSRFLVTAGFLALPSFETPLEKRSGLHGSFQNMFPSRLDQTHWLTMWQKPFYAITESLFSLLPVRPSSQKAQLMPSPSP